MVDSCDHGNEPSGSMKGGESLDYQLLRNCSIDIILK
jgi:hypothetical protein